MSIRRRKIFAYGFLFLKQKQFLVIVAALLSITASSQDLDPRVYANLPKNMNAVALYYGYLKGNVVAEPSLPIKDLKITSNNLALGYVHTFGLANKLARVQLSIPLVFMAGNAKINGRDTSAGRDGFGDTRIRIGINLLGSPALDRKDFRNYEQKTIVGVSLVASVPTGLYYKEKLINIGSNRWGLKPEAGISRRFKHVYAEAYIGVWFYTDNTEYLGKKVLVQKPVASIQAHASYYFKNQMWIGINTNWFNGGETLIDNIPSGDLRDNWRLGATLSAPITKFQSVKLQVNAGAFINTGLDYNVVSLTYQYIFF